MNNSPAYSDRYCAFVDILGFRQLIEQLNQGTAQFKSLHALLKRVHGANSGAAVDADDTDFRAQSISDAVAISTKATSQGLAEIFNSLRSLSLDLLVEGYFVRGAVVRAPLYHDDRMVFGAALVRAYYFEFEIAKFPRIVVSREVREDILKFMAKPRSERFPKIEMLRQSSDGPMYLDILRPVISVLAKNDHPFEKLTAQEQEDRRRYRGIKDKIQIRYEEAMDYPRHFEKVRWFARYWNETIPDKYFLKIRSAEREF